MLLKILKGIYCILRIFYFMPIYLSLFFTKRLKKDIHELWALRTCEYLKIKFKRLNDTRISDKKTLFLSNHRSQGDFFIHDVILEHKTSVLARYAVAIVFPWFYILQNGTIWFFKRGGNINVEKFNAWLDSKFTKSIRPSLLAYPEGHRMYGTKTVESIKTGMIKYAYSRKIPIQILMSFGNENVMNEKKLQFKFNEIVAYGLSEVIDPKDFQVQKEFVELVTKRFKEFFEQIYQKNQLEQEKSK